MEKADSLIWFMSAISLLVKFLSELKQKNTEDVDVGDEEVQTEKKTQKS